MQNSRASTFQCQTKLQKKLRRRRHPFRCPTPHRARPRPDAFGAMKNKKKRQERNAAEPRAIDPRVGDVASDSEDEFADGEFMRKRKKATVPGTGYVAAGKAPPAVDASYVNKGEKTLVLTSRVATSRYRHLMLDLMTLIPNAKKDAKMDTKNERQVVIEAADLRGCTSAMFFECRKNKIVTCGLPSVRVDRRLSFTWKTRTRWLS